MYSPPQRIQFLDSIRGLAALFVLLGHTLGAFDWPASYIAYAHLPFISIASSGCEAVAMFFVLSGYVLTRPFANNGNLSERKIFLPTFYLRRIIRIWPPWFFAFAVSIFAKSHLFFHPSTEPSVSEWLGRFWHAKLTVADFFRQCVFQLHDPTRLLLVQDWSLGVELKGSVLIPIFFICTRRKYWYCVFPITAFLLIFVGTGHYYISFLIGVLVAQYERSWLTWLTGLGKFTRAALLIGGLQLYQSYDLALTLFPGSRAAIKYGWIFSAFGCALLLMAVFSNQHLQRILNQKTFVFLGKISYSLYLFQFIVILCLLPPLVSALNDVEILQPSILLIVVLILSIAATIVCSAAMYHFIEKPIINFGHWLTKYIQR